MPKVNPKDVEEMQTIDDLINDELIDDDDVNDDVVEPVKAKHIIPTAFPKRTGVTTKYTYTEGMTQEEKQKMRARLRREKRNQDRIDRGETIRTRASNLTPDQRLTAKQARRETRNDTRNLAYYLISLYWQVNVETAYNDLKDMVQSGTIPASLKELIDLRS